MNKEFIPYNLALELKELGFDEPCIAFYEPGNKEVQVVGVEQRYNDPELLRLKDFCAPLYQQAFRWFREKYFLGHGINPYSLDTHLIDLEDCIFYDIDDVYTYEEAELACLKKLIEIAKNK